MAISFFVRFLCLFALIPSVMSAAEKATPTWSEKMQKLSQTVSDLMPDLVSSKPPDAKTLKKLRAGAKTLSTLAHQIKMTADGKKATPPPDADPSLSLLSALFERESKSALRSLETGNVEYGKASLRLVTSYCISCHTRTDQGPQFPALPIDAKVTHLNRMERAQLFAATRQFDKALEEFEGVISDPAIAAKRQLEWGRAVRHAFTIAIRVQRDPERALKILKRVEALPSTPALFRDFVAAWKKSITEWKSEGNKKFTTEAALFEEANRLAKLAEGSQKYPMDHSADVLYLRVSLAAHELLAQFPEGKHLAETLLLLGNAYDLLDDHLISPLPEMYYETCIRRTPHSATAEKCYRRYEANVYFGYTGSAGTSIPEDISSVMKELKDLARPKKS